MSSYDYNTDVVQILNYFDSMACQYLCLFFAMAFLPVYPAKEKRKQYVGYCGEIFQAKYSAYIRVGKMKSILKKLSMPAHYIFSLCTANKNAY